MSISIRSAVKAFGKHAAVNHVSAEIADGEFFVILGASGCGKTTLLRLIAGLETLDSGEILINGKTVAGPGLHLPPEERRVGMVFQSYALWPHMTVVDNVAFPVKAAGLGKRKAHDIAARQIDAVSLTGFEQRKPSELSGGQRQRVALARCLAGNADTILMDEPLANLDPHLRSSMEEELAAFHRMAGATTLFITHDQREGMALADRIAVMENGRFLQVGAPDDIYRFPESEKVARFIGQSAIVPALYNGNGAAMIAGKPVPVETRDKTGREARAVIRPADVTVDADGLVASIKTIAYRGGVWEARLTVEGVDEALPLVLDRKAKPGDAVPVAIRSAWLLPD